MSVLTRENLLRLDPFDAKQLLVKLERLNTINQELKAEKEKLQLKLFHASSIILYQIDKLKIADQVIKLYREELHEEAGKRYRYYQQLKGPKAEAKLARDVRDHLVFQRTKLEPFLLYLERKDLGKDVLPPYERCVEECSRLDLDSSVVLVRPDLNHMGQALKMSKRQIQKYFRACVRSGMLHRIRQKNSASCFIIGEWYCYSPKKGHREGKLTWNRLYIWRNRAKRAALMKALNCFEL